jgi:4'-phosphopantetheinyl transferase
LLDGRAVRDETLASFLPLLSPDELKRHGGFLRRERQRQFLLGRMLLRLAISGITGIPVRAISTAERPGSGPQLQLPENIEPPHFSLSHSRQWIGCAVSVDNALGLDIETIDPGRDLTALSETAFLPEEHSWLLERTDVERTAAFYQLWTLKEALFKLLSNRGASTATASLVDGRGALLSHADGWSCRSVAHPQLSITVCSTLVLVDIALIQPSLDMLEV